jgi:hypothetical protein
MRFWIVTFLIVPSLLGACGRQKRTAKDAAHKIAARSKVIAELASSYRADVTWRKPFEDYSRLRRTYTYELQEALIRPDGRPVVLVGPIDDIIRLDDGQYEVRSHELLGLGPQIYFQLACTKDQVGAFLSKAPKLLDEYAFVAKVSRLSAPRLSAAAERDATDDVPSTEIVVEPAEVVVAVGQCIDISKLGEQ